MKNKEGRVYEIYALHPKGKDFTPKQTYVGKTSIGLRERFGLHKSDSRRFDSKISRFIREFGAENLEMELIERCKGHLEAAQLEGYWAEVLGAGLNSEMPGSHTGVSKKEYRRSYYERNKEREKSAARRYWAEKSGKRPRPEGVPLPPPDAEGV